MKNFNIAYIVAISIFFATVPAYSMDYQEKIRIMSGSGDGLNRVSRETRNIQPITIPHKGNPFLGLGSSTSSFNGAEYIKQITTSYENNNTIQNVQTTPSITKPKKSTFACLGRK